MKRSTRSEYVLRSDGSTDADINVRKVVKFTEVEFSTSLSCVLAKDVQIEEPGGELRGSWKNGAGERGGVIEVYWIMWEGNMIDAFYLGDVLCRVRKVCRQEIRGPFECVFKTKASYVWSMRKESIDRKLKNFLMIGSFKPNLLVTKSSISHLRFEFFLPRTAIYAPVALIPFLMSVSGCKCGSSGDPSRLSKL